MRRRVRRVVGQACRYTARPWLHMLLAVADHRLGAAAAVLDHERLRAVVRVHVGNVAGH